MGKKARLKRLRRDQGRLTVEELHAIECLMFAEAAHDCRREIVECLACGTPQANRKETPCPVCDGNVARYLTTPPLTYLTTPPPARAVA